jgi:hypothetical protein
MKSLPACLPSRNRQGQAGARLTFPDECCFQVIYFVANISFVAASELIPKPVRKAFG